MNEAFTSNWKALGLNFRSPFDILNRPRATPRPPKVRKPAKSQRERVIASLEDLPHPSHFNTDIMSREESDRTLAIAGRGLA